jgi:hypothetical protein
VQHLKKRASDEHSEHQVEQHKKGAEQKTEKKKDGPALGG